MIFGFGAYKIDVDVERTRRFYETMDDIDWCTCPGCRNFRKAYPLIPGAVQAFFRQFGVDIGYPTEMSAIASHDGNMTLYDGFYHICGSILESPELYIQIDEKTRQLNPEATIKLTPDHFVYFTDKCGLIVEGFPSPIIQLVLQGDVPWVLDEPNPYHYSDH